MNDDLASLDNLRDIVEPPPVSWWPPAPGWWMLFAIFASVASVVIWRRWQTWRANAYRRAALAELRSTADARAIAEILKRVALVANPRTEIASKTGPAWLSWLESEGGQPLPRHAAQMMTDGVFGELAPANIADLTSFASAWIKHHPDRRKSEKPEVVEC